MKHPFCIRLKFCHPKCKTVDTFLDQKFQEKPFVAVFANPSRGEVAFSWNILKVHMMGMSPSKGTLEKWKQS